MRAISLISLLLIVWKVALSQEQTTEKITDSPSEDYVDRGQDGSYRYGYRNGNRGAHYHTASASADNTVSGRFGYRDPATNRLVQTIYTAGSRGFRARGPNIARRMDLSQSKSAYRPPVSPNSPNYQPSYNTYYDPNEDPSYDFSFKTPTYSRGENADSKGNVNGAYSYIDDVGKRHDVQFEAGSKTGFLVKTPFPDSDPFPGVFYQGPNKPGTPPRGHSAVIRGNDGSYKFSSSGPDQQRTEVSDSANRVRGSYTYIDDKGVQRTVHYIAGPNIGYKVIRKGAGPIYSSVYPYTRPEFISPTLNDVNIPNLGTSITTSTLSTLSLDRDDLYSGLDGNLDSGLFKPAIESKNPSVQYQNYDDDFGGVLPTRKTTTVVPSYTPSTQKPSYNNNNNNNNNNDNNYGTDTSTRKPFYQSYRPFKKDDQNNLLPPGVNAYLTPYNKRTKYPESAVAEEDEYSARKTTNYEENSLSNDRFGKPVSDTSRNSNDLAEDENRKGYEYPKPDKNLFPDEQYNSNRGYTRHVNDNKYSGSNNNFLGIPPGFAIRAHVQSLDILPYGSRVPPPEQALQEQMLNERSNG